MGLLKIMNVLIELVVILPKASCTTQQRPYIHPALIVRVIRIDQSIIPRCMLLCLFLLLPRQRIVGQDQGVLR